MTTLMQTDDLNVRAALARAFGHSGFSDRDFDKVFGYTKSPTSTQLLEMYKCQGVAKRIINAPCDAIWASPPKIVSDEAFTSIWNDLIVRFKLFQIFNRADKLAGIGDFSILVAGFDDGRLDQPLNESRKNKLLYLQPYWQGSITIKKYNEDSRSADYGKPLIYKIDPTKNARLSSGLGDKQPRRPPIEVHSSRVIHVAEDTLENEVFGFSRLSSVYNLLQDLTKVTGGAAEAFWLVANRGLHIDVDKDLNLTAEDQAALSEEVTEYSEQLTRFIRTRGVTVTSLGSDTPDPKGTFDVILSLISGTTGIPRRILSGAEAGQLASAQDRANWADRIDERRVLFADPTILYPFIKLMTRAGVLPIADITIEWPEAFKMSPLERAQTSAQSARSATNVASAVEKWDRLKTANREADLSTKLIGSVVNEVVANEDGESLPLTRKEDDRKDDVSVNVGDGNNQGEEGEGEEEMGTMTLSPTIADEGELLTLDEARSIIGFRSDSPIFDDMEDIIQNPVTD